jgi:hypothetical protein
MSVDPSGRGSRRVRPSNDPGRCDDEHHVQGRLLGQDCAEQQHARRQGSLPPVGVQTEHQERCSGDLGEISTSAPEIAPVSGQNEAPHRVATAVASQKSAAESEGAQRDHIGDDQRDWNQRSLATGQEPCNCRIADALEARDRVHADSERGPGQIGGIEGHSVVERPVVAATSHDGDVPGQRAADYMLTSHHDEEGWVSVRGDEQPADHEDGCGEARNECNCGRGVAQLRPPLGRPCERSLPRAAHRRHARTAAWSVMGASADAMFEQRSDRQESNGVTVRDRNTRSAPKQQDRPNRVHVQVTTA